MRDPYLNGKRGTVTVAVRARNLPFPSPSRPSNLRIERAKPVTVSTRGEAMQDMHAQKIMFVNVVEFVSVFWLVRLPLICPDGHIRLLLRHFWMFFIRMWIITCGVPIFVLWIAHKSGDVQHGRIEWFIGHPEEDNKLYAVQLNSVYSFATMNR